MVDCLQNTANFLSSRSVLLEAAQLFDESNRTSAACNLETLIDNYETTTKEYDDIIVTKVLLSEFTKTIDQSIILDHVLKEKIPNSSTESENQIKS
ncbi:hypothetical protein WDU94_010355 [Cyamophila willieti]